MRELDRHATVGGEEIEKLACMALVLSGPQGSAIVDGLQRRLLHASARNIATRAVGQINI
jgi:hypothetical protein